MARSMVLIFILALIASSASAADDRYKTMGILSQLSASEEGLKAWLNEGDVEEIALGSPIQFRFLSDHDAYLTAIHIDSQGVATLLFPTHQLEAGRILAGKEMVFPPSDWTLALEAQLPLGAETVLGLTSPEPLDRESLGFGESAERLVVVDGKGAQEVAQRLVETLASRPAGSIKMARIEYKIVSGSGDSSYTAQRLERYFTERQRSINHATLDLDIKFHFDSAELTDGAKANLDIVGDALTRELLENDRFRVAGHTDRVGDDQYNQDLSERRAQSARRYLLDNFSTDPRDRIKAVNDTLKSVAELTKKELTRDTLKTAAIPSISDLTNKQGHDRFNGIRPRLSNTTTPTLP